jgi:CBS domain-containing protein
MKVADVMTKSCRIISANNSLQKAAEIMNEENIGALPVAENDRLIGVITDRDIVTRGLAKGKGGKARVREAMTQNVKYCYEDEELDHTLQNMAEIQLRRLPVMNRQKRLVGMISLADAARSYSPDAVGAAYCGVVGAGDAIHHASLD